MFGDFGCLFIILNKALGELAKATDTSHLWNVQVCFPQQITGGCLSGIGPDGQSGFTSGCGPRDGRVGLGEKAMWSRVYFLLGKTLLLGFPSLSVVESHRHHNNVLFPSQVQTLSSQAPQFPYRKCRLSAQKQRSRPCFLAFMCAQSCLTLCNPMECSLLGFSVHGIFQAIRLVVVVVQSLSHVRLFMTPWTVACQASLSITNSQSLLKLTSMELVMPSNHLILCCPLLLPPSIFASIRVFSNDSVPHIRWPKYWSLSFNTSLSNDYPGLISFGMDWLDLLSVKRILKGLLQHHSSYQPPINIYI